MPSYFFLCNITSYAQETRQKVSSDVNLADKPWTTAEGVKNGEWHGFRIYESKIDEYRIWVAEPKIPVKGKPWIMRIQDFGDGFHWQINEKLLNSGASRAGLSAYRWAIRHPERVACIYCEGPVLDFKTWPMSWPSSADNRTEFFCLLLHRK